MHLFSLNLHIFDPTLLYYLCDSTGRGYIKALANVWLCYDLIMSTQIIFVILNEIFSRASITE